MTQASTQMVTRCPKCATAFRITSTQLQSASGAVRCGSCLHVFKAQQHLATAVPKKPAEANPSPTSAASPSSAKPVTTPTNKAAAPTAQAIKAPTATNTTQPTTNPKPPTAAPIASSALSTRPAPTSNFRPDNQQTKKPAITSQAPKAPIKKSEADLLDEQLISDDMDSPAASTQKSAYEFDGFLDVDLKPKLDVSLFERAPKKPTEDSEVKPSDDESWAEMLLDDEDTTPPVFANIKRNASTSPAPAQPIFTENNESTTQPKQAETTKTGLTFSLIEDSEAEPDDHTQAEHSDFVISDELAQLPNSAAIGGQKNQATENTDAPHDRSQNTGASQVKTEPKIRAYDNSRSALLMNIIPAPVEFTSKRINSWSSRKLWPSLSIIMFIALTAQLSWFKFDYFSRVEPYRNAYLLICPHIGCQVPTLVNIKKISAYQVTVRPHPDVEDALLVDLMILNQAPFDQAFPNLVLAFTDMDGQPVASRRFTPQEYLGGELAGRTIMPKEQPIHLSLDIADPGLSAINYHVYMAP